VEISSPVDDRQVVPRYVWFRTMLCDACPSREMLFDIVLRSFSLKGVYIVYRTCLAGVPGFPCANDVGKMMRYASSSVNGIYRISLIAGNKHNTHLYNNRQELTCIHLQKKSSQYTSKVTCKSTTTPCLQATGSRRRPSRSLRTLRSRRPKV
jgi:hypothetical protein